MTLLQGIACNVMLCLLAGISSSLPVMLTFFREKSKEDNNNTSFRYYYCREGIGGLFSSCKVKLPYSNDDGNESIIKNINHLAVI